MGRARQQHDRPPTPNRGRAEAPRAGRLAGLGMWAGIWALSWPNFIDRLLYTLVGFIDTALAAQLSIEDTDAVGAGSLFMYLFGFVAGSVGLALKAIVGRAIGAGKRGVASAMMSQGLSLACIAGVAVSLAVAIGAGPLASAIDLEGIARDRFISYTQVSAWSVVPMAIAMTLQDTCRALGDARTAMLVAALVNVVNLIASYLLSGVDLALGGLALTNLLNADLGTVGIALGTVIGWSIGAVVYLVLAVRGMHGIRLRAHWLRPRFLPTRRLVKLAVPIVLEQGAFWLVQVFVLMLVGRLVLPGAVGTHIAVTRLTSVVLASGVAFSATASVLVAQYLGAGRPDLARRAAARCALLAAAIAGLCSIVLFVAPTQVMSLMTQQPEHLADGPALLSIAAFVQAPIVVWAVMAGALRGAGATALALKAALITGYGLRLPMVWLGSGIALDLPFGVHLANPAPLLALGVGPLAGVWIAMAAEDALRCTVFLLAFFRSKLETLRP